MTTSADGGDDDEGRRSDADGGDGDDADSPRRRVSSNH